MNGFEYSIVRGGARIAAALFATLFFTLCVPTAAGAQSDHCGDVNGDGNVTTVDALMVLRRAVGVPVEFNCPPASSVRADGSVAAMEAGACGDVSGDGNTTTIDSLMILNYSIGVPVEFMCAVAPAGRNLIRYLNNLVCMQQIFTSTVTVKPSGRMWESESGVHSEYQGWDEPTIGPEFLVTTGECGDLELFGTINLPANTKILMELRLGGLFNNIPELAFFDEGPIDALTTGDPVPLAVFRASPADSAGEGLGGR